MSGKKIGKSLAEMVKEAAAEYPNSILNNVILADQENRFVVVFTEDELDAIYTLVNDAIDLHSKHYNEGQLKILDSISDKIYYHLEAKEGD